MLYICNVQLMLLHNVGKCQNLLLAGNKGAKYWYVCVCVYTHAYTHTQ